MEVLLAPPLAFVIYLLAASGLALLGKVMAPPEQSSGSSERSSGNSRSSPLKTTPYASGNAPLLRAAPGYRAFFVIALFFAALHLGALVIGSSDLSAASAVYIVGLAVTLIALLLG